MRRLVNLNRRAYETQRKAKHESLRPLPEWLAEMLDCVQKSPGKQAFDQEAYERERLAKHGITIAKEQADDTNT